MLLYYITDRSQFPGSESDRRQLLLQKIAEAVRCNVDYIQLREKDLSARALERLANQAVQVVAGVRSGKPRTALLINSRADIALVAGAAGVQLRSDDISPGDVRMTWARRNASAPILAVSCHTPDEVARAGESGADFAVFAPVFEKPSSSAPPAGLDVLRQACRRGIPVLALGGVTLGNARECLEAGAAGVAAIRLFQQNNMERVVSLLRS